MYKSSYLLVLSIFVFILSCENIPTDSGNNTIVFEDINFENLIRETVNKPDGGITIIDMQSILILRGYKKNIENINGIENCTNLKELYLGENNIENIKPLSNLTTLENLSLHFNNIEDLTYLENLNNLQALVLADNNISDIKPLENLTALNFLKVGGNNISDIQPLVLNNGIGNGDTINMVDNPLSETSINIYIPELEARGVRIYH